MHFDYTFIRLGDFTLWEPMVSVTNLTLFLIALYAFAVLRKFKDPYPLNMGRFMLIMGISACFGAVAHGIHHDYGVLAFDVVVYVSNALSLVSAYFCFSGAWHRQNRGKNTSNSKVLRTVAVWIMLMLLVTLLWNNFVIIKIHAGVILLYALVVHYSDWRRNRERGSAMVVTGIAVSFFSILVHSLKISLHEYFNYKDIAHVIMIISLVIIYRGIRLNAQSANAVSMAGQMA